MSLDGFTAHRNGDMLQHSNPSKNDYGFRKFFKSVDSVIFNRDYYDLLLSYDVRWPFGDKQCHIVSEEKFYTSPNQNVQFILANNSLSIIEQVKVLQQASGGNIWLAGDNMISLFTGHGMIDEFILNILPVLLGNGLPLFMSCNTECSLKLLSAEQFNNGVVQLHYRKD